MATVHVAAILAAGGRGARFGGQTPKQLIALAGRPMLARCLDRFLQSDRIHEIVIVLPPETLERPPEFLLAGHAKPVHLASGGARRQDSVANGFAVAAARADIVVVHDAARPFVTQDLIARAIDAAADTGAAVAACVARDTVKLTARHGDGARFVVRTSPREDVYLAQTPQAFRVDVLRRALAAAGAGPDATDEAALVERAGWPVAVVEGDPGNIKITTPDDFATATARLLGGDRDGQPRVGAGYDLHRLVEGRPLVLGGVRVPFEKGLLGHSDADVLSHAIADAVLGAVRAGDIGRWFPDTDPQWAGADSLVLLARAAAIVREAGFEIENIDAVVVAERPKLAPHVEAITVRLAEAMNLSPDCVSVKGKTNEGLGEIGRGEAMAAHAVALVRRVRRADG
jgi:2-C-methyl-D-erythritol 4-phosphate cytidylyltransferase/2-C-methyl-D-erythritol 2,4-cyclodiphosphate synthase